MLNSDKYLRLYNVQIGDF